MRVVLTDVRAQLVVSTSRRPASAFCVLGAGESKQGQRALARLLHRALAGSAYGELPCYRSTDDIVAGDVSHLAAVPEQGSPLLITATIAGELVAAFWGYGLGAAPLQVREGLRAELAHTAGREAAALDRLGVGDAARASRAQIGRLHTMLAAPHLEVFYADWIAVDPAFRGRGLARLLWSLGLEQALTSPQFTAYVSRTIGQRRALLERFYCEEIGARAYLAWEDDGLQRIAFGGARCEALTRALMRACAGLIRADTGATPQLVIGTDRKRSPPPG